MLTLEVKSTMFPTACIDLDKNFSCEEMLEFCANICNEHFGEGAWYVTTYDADNSFSVPDYYFVRLAGEYVVCVADAEKRGNLIWYGNYGGYKENRTPNKCYPRKEDRFGNKIYPEIMRWEDCH